MGTPEILIRGPALADVGALQRLCAELGYEPSRESLEQTVAELGKDHSVLVAEAEGEVVAWIELAVLRPLTSGPECLICGFVVTERLRGQKVGERLLAAAEDWGREHGLPLIRVRSRDTRTRAHAFYERLGYEVQKRQLVFRKRLKIEA